MNALGCREAKWNIDILGTSGMQARDGGRDDFCGFARPLPRRH